MTIHGVVAFAGVPTKTLERFEDTHGGRARRIDTPGAHGSLALYAMGEEGKTLRSESRGSNAMVVFGSGVGLAPTGLWDVVRNAIETKTMDRRVSDTVALEISGDQLTAVTGDGAHRLFIRRLPSGGQVLSSHLATAVTADTPAGVDRSYEDFMLGFGFLPDGRTMFEGTRELPVGSVWQSDETFSTIALESGPSSGEQDDETDLIPRLLDAVDRLSASDDDCAVLLGGFDSALVCALLRELGKSVTGYTFDFGEPGYNQAKIDEVVSELDISHKWIRIGPDRLRDAFGRFPALLNAPGAQPHYQLHTVFATEEIARDGFEIVLTGDGCDALFLGYPSVSSRSDIMNRTSRLPAPVAGALIRILSNGPVERHLGHVARVSRSVLRASTLPYPASGHLPTQYLDDFSLSSLRSGPPPESPESIVEIRSRLATGLEALDVKRLAFAGQAATGASRLKVDGAVMTTGVANVTPFKDAAVVRLANSLPVEALRPTGSPGGSLGKQYLIDRVIESGLLSPDIVLQPKQSPSTSPIDRWYMNELHDDVMKQLDSLPFEWNREYVETLLRPKRAETWYRDHVALSPHALQAIGMLVSYAGFSRLAS